ncbi:esterase-like activity of phytase family protein [Escherichia coli]|nr:esterase-like activity of phytase family protein [Escherichia coli]
MKRKIIPVLIGCTLSFSALAAQPTAERYVVSFPEGTHVNYAGAFASAFPNGLPVGIGSGLLFTGKQGDALTFATITDRGPNADSPKEGKNETKIFVTLAQKTQVVDLRSLGWQQEKAEGLALIDSKTLAVANDNDFGVKVAMQHPVEGKTFKDYRVNAEGKLTLDDKQVETTLRVKPLEKPESDSELWIVTLPEALK